MIYRQRTTAIDDFLLRFVCPWLVALHATPLLRLARIWTEPVDVGAENAPSGYSTDVGWDGLGGWRFASSIDGTLRQVKREQSSAH